MMQDQFDCMPGGAAIAYGAIIRRTETPRSIEYRVFSEVTAALLTAEEDDVPFPGRIQATHRNRELWQTLAFDVADDGNALPDDLRARLVSLAMWVGRETERVLKEHASLQDLIEINRSIMLGLQPRGQEAV